MAKSSEPLPTAGCLLPTIFLASLRWHLHLIFYLTRDDGAQRKDSKQLWQKAVSPCLLPAAYCQLPTASCLLPTIFLASSRWHLHAYHNRQISRPQTQRSERKLTAAYGRPSQGNSIRHSRRIRPGRDIPGRLCRDRSCRHRGTQSRSAGGGFHRIELRGLPPDPAEPCNVRHLRRFPPGAARRFPRPQAAGPGGIYGRHILPRSPIRMGALRRPARYCFPLGDCARKVAMHSRTPFEGGDSRSRFKVSADPDRVPERQVPQLLWSGSSARVSLTAARPVATTVVLSVPERMVRRMNRRSILSPLMVLCRSVE